MISFSLLIVLAIPNFKAENAMTLATVNKNMANTFNVSQRKLELEMKADLELQNYSDLNHDMQHEVLFDKNLPNESYFEPLVVVENPKLVEEVKQSAKLTSQEKKELVDLHNLYRMNVTPIAGNMEWMRWDDKLAAMSLAWAETCIWDHGVASSPKYYDSVGQNLYMGTWSEVGVALYLWYEEFKYYDFHKNYCTPGKQCGHYTQMAWATSNKVGCARHLCRQGTQYYIVCNYHPPGNYQGQKPYKVGTPCSLCETRDGGLCHSKLCVTKQDCSAENLDCSCNLKCYSGGALDRSKCSCKCKDGWDRIDCSDVCRDEHEMCNKNPGFPSKYACSLMNYTVAKVHCRKMCETCKSVGESSTNKFCDGKLCTPGYVLTGSCHCQLLCPGLKCGSESIFGSFWQNAFLVTALILGHVLRENFGMI